MTANNPMTGEQLDELMTVAVNMQRDSEKVGERRVAMFAYAVQVAVLELRKVREIKPVAENHVAAMNSIKAIIAILGSSDTLGISEQVAELKAQCDALAAENAGLKSAIKEIVDSAEEAEYDGYFSFVVNPDAIHAGSDLIESETPATDAYLAEVRAQGVEMLAEHLSGMNISASETSVREFAAQLRKGVQS